MSNGEDGRVVDGRFALQARLGGGGMGTVWRARDLVLDRAVALKEVRPADPALAEYDPQAARLLRARVLREARALARVDHPDVVTIHHIVDGGEGTYPWLVMELVTGGSLADRLAEGPMEPAEAARLGRGVLAGLRAAHEARVQHRDVKPANVLLRPDGRPVLTDFGIAAIRESTVLTATGSVIGTPDYMAPERVSGGEGGPGADLWSLAMMLYTAVEGRHPLRRATTLATLAAVLNDEIPPPRRAGALAPVLAAVLVRDPAARPDAETVARMLAEAAEAAEAGGLSSAPAGAVPTPTSYPLASPADLAEPAEAAEAGGLSSAPAGAVPTPTSYALASPAEPAEPAEDNAADMYEDAVPASRPAGNSAVPSVPRTAAGGQAAARRARTVRRAAIGASIAATVLTGVLVWSSLPDDGAEAGAEAGAQAGAEAGAGKQPAGSATGPRTPAPTASPNETAVKPEQVDLLTPEGIRTAIAAFKAEAGSDRSASVAVYPEFVSARVMLKDDDKRYDTWTYRAGAGAEKGIINGSLSGGDRTFSLDEFDWDVVPGLLARAEKELKVKDIDSRYLLVRPPDDTFGSPLALVVHLRDEYGVGGYIEADLTGKVTRVIRDED